MFGTRMTIEGRSFFWLFVLCFGLAIVPVESSGHFGLRTGIGKLMFALSMAIPFLLQVFSGFALDQWWVARYGRNEQPHKYWAWLAVWGFGALVFALYALVYPHGGAVAA